MFIATDCGHIILLKENGLLDFRSGLLLILFFFAFFINSCNHINVSLNLQSRAHPREIMVEVLKALQELNVCWKKNGHYNMKCRWCSGAPEVHDMLDVNSSFLGDSVIMDNDDTNGRLPSVIKFEMQVFNSFFYNLLILFIMNSVLIFNLVVSNSYIGI